MWELAIVFNKENENYLSIVKSAVKKAFSKKKYICTLFLEEYYIKLLIACEENFKPLLIQTLNETLSELFVNNYKETFLIHHLKLENVEEMEQKAFIQALVCFDREYDKSVVQKKLKYDSKLYLNSFFAFNCKNLREKWLDICELTNDNADFLTSQGTFLELLKFLIKNLKTQKAVVNIIYKNNRFEFLDERQKKIKFQIKNRKKDEIFFIQNLIKLNPETIQIFCDGTIKVDTLNLINELFSGKITMSKI